MRPAVDGGADILARVAWMRAKSSHAREQRNRNLPSHKHFHHWPCSCPPARVRHPGGWPVLSVQDAARRRKRWRQGRLPGRYISVPGRDDDPPQRGTPRPPDAAGASPPSWKPGPHACQPLVPLSIVLRTPPAHPATRGNGSGPRPSARRPGAPRMMPMGLPRRLAVLTAVMAILLVTGATEIALWWSGRTRLEDFRLETVALANTLASLLVRSAPHGDSASLATGPRRLGPPPHQRLPGDRLPRPRQAPLARRRERRERHDLRQPCGVRRARAPGHRGHASPGRGARLGGRRAARHAAHVRGARRARLDAPAAGLGPAGAAPRLPARPDLGAPGRALRGGADGAMGRSAAGRARHRDGRRPRRRHRRAGRARDRAPRVPRADPPVQPDARGALGPRARERRSRHAPDARGAGPRPRPPRADARDGRDVRARDRHPAQHGERPPPAAARRFRGPAGRQGRRARAAAARAGRSRGGHRARGPQPRRRGRGRWCGDRI